MNIRIITPALAHSRTGNRVTAQRWARILRELKHRVTIQTHYQGEPCDALIALHARRSSEAVEKFHRLYPDHPLIVTLTGTDLYRDIGSNRKAQRSLELASRLVVLQPLGIEALPVNVRAKARAIYQSVSPSNGRVSANRSTFDVCVVGHLRAVKDPFRAALAARLLPASSKIRVLHVGKVMTPAMESRAQAENARNTRYQWLGERPRWQTRKIMSRCRVLVHPSKMEGGANAIAEALVDAVPVISSRIEGSIGMLGPHYPGYFPVGDTRALAGLLSRAEVEAKFYERLRAACAKVAPLFSPVHERASWRKLLAELPAP